MRTLILLVCLTLATFSWGQVATKPNADRNPAPSPSPTWHFSQSAVQGCVMGSAVTGQFVLTDENTGQIYLLQGNEPELKAQVGREAVITGTATPMASQQGAVGYQRPSAATTGGATQLAGKAALNFNVTFVQRVADQCSRSTQSQKDAIAASEAALGSVQTNNRSALEPRIGYVAQKQSGNTLLGCINGAGNHFVLTQPQERRSYRLLGNPGQLADNVGRLVQVSGYIIAGTGAQQESPRFQVSQLQAVEDSCTYQAPPGMLPQPATGKTGNQGDAFNVTDTSSIGYVTPGNETQAGRFQEPGRETGLIAGGVPQPQNQTAADGAPLIAEQTAQNPVAALRYRDAAALSELSNAQQQLGVNAQPDYSQVQPQQQSLERTNKAAQQGQAYPRNRNSQTAPLPGASQTMNYPRETVQKRARAAAEHHETQPTLVGCLTGSGHDFVLREQNSGAQYRLNATPEELKDHVNHLVELVGKPDNRQGATPAVAESKKPVFAVTGVRDLAPTCGAEGHR